VSLVDTVCALKLIVVSQRVFCCVYMLGKFAPQGLGASLGLDERVQRALDANMTYGVTIFGAVRAGVGA